MARLSHTKLINQLTKIPWTSWTPTITSDSGALAHTFIYAEYLKVGKLVFYTVAFDISANGSGNIAVTTPSGLTPITNSCGVGREYKVIGHSISSLVLTSGSILLLTYLPATPAVNGYGVIFNGFYRVA